MPGGASLRQAGLAVLLVFTACDFALIAYLLYNFFASLREAAKEEGRERGEATEAAAAARAPLGSAGVQQQQQQQQQLEKQQQQQQQHWQGNPLLVATSASPTALAVARSGTPALALKQQPAAVGGAVPHSAAPSSPRTPLAGAAVGHRGLYFGPTSIVGQQTRARLRAAKAAAAVAADARGKEE